MIRWRAFVTGLTLLACLALLTGLLPGRAARAAASFGGVTKRTFGVTLFVGNNRHHALGSGATVRPSLPNAASRDLAHSRAYALGTDAGAPWRTR